MKAVECQWLSPIVLEDRWISMSIDVYQSILTNIKDYQWLSLKTNSHQGLWMDIHENSWLVYTIKHSFMPINTNCYPFMFTDAHSYFIVCIGVPSHSLISPVFDIHDGVMIFDDSCRISMNMNWYENHQYR